MASEDKRRCPSCGGTDVRRSYPGGLRDSIMNMFRKRPFRCRGCRRRFYAYDAASANPEVAEQPDPSAFSDQTSK